MLLATALSLTTIVAAAPPAPERVESDGFTFQCRYQSSPIERGMNQLYGQLEQCYAKARQTDPTLETELTARFIIAPTGAVKSVDVTHRLDKKHSLPACVKYVIVRQRFERPGVDIEVSYPLRFVVDSSAHDND